ALGEDGAPTFEPVNAWLASGPPRVVKTGGKLRLVADVAGETVLVGRDRRGQTVIRDRAGKLVTPPRPELGPPRPVKLRSRYRPGASALPSDALGEIDGHPHGSLEAYHHLRAAAL